MSLVCSRSIRVVVVVVVKGDTRALQSYRTYENRSHSLPVRIRTRWFFFFYITLSTLSLLPSDAKRQRVTETRRVFTDTEQSANYVLTGDGSAVFVPSRLS